MDTSSWHYSAQHPALGSLGVGSNFGGLIVDGFGDTVHRYLPPVGHFVFKLKIFTPFADREKHSMGTEHTKNALSTHVTVLFGLEAKSAGASRGGDGTGPAYGFGS